MKFLKKIVTAVLAALLASSAAGCAADKSWAAKDSSLTIPIGAYIYNLYYAYSQAQSKVTDSSKAVLDQKIENKDAASWIREKALTYTKSLLLVDQKMKEMHLTLTDDEKKQAEQAGASAWNSYSSQFEKYGIAKSSFQLAYADNVYKEDKIFEAVYGKGGQKEVSDSGLKDYYVKTYTSFSYLRYPMYTTNSDGSFKAAYTDAEKKKAKAVLDGYVPQIRAGKLTLRQAADSLKKTLKSSEDPLQSATVDLSSSSSLPSALTKVLKAMKTGEIQTVEISDDYSYYLLSKNDIQKEADEKLKTDSSRKQVLAAFKWDEFTEELGKEADSMKGITLNNDAIRSYNPSMFAG